MFVHTYASTDFTGGVGETIKRKGGVSQACLGKSTSFVLHIHNMVNDSCQNRIATDQYHITISRDRLSTHWHDVIHFVAVCWPVNCFTRCLISCFLASMGAQENWQCTHIQHQCCVQLTAVKTGYPLTSTTWPYRGLRGRPNEVKYFVEVIRWQVTSFQMITGSILIFFKIHKKNVYFCRTIKILISKWPLTWKSSQLLQAGRQLLFTLLTMITRWSCYTSNFYAVTGQNLTGEFMRKIYAASCLLWQPKLTEFCVNLWCF